MSVNRTSNKGKVLDIPANAPTIGTPTDAGDGTTANVAFTAPSTATGGPIFSYTAVSNPGSFTGTTTTSTSTVAVTGLTTGTAYTFTVTANNPTGSSPASSSSSSLTLAVPTSFESIATAVGTGSNTTITFSSIPSTYTHLQVRGFARSARTAGTGAGLQVIVNSDSGANYSSHRLYGDGTSAGATGASGASYIINEDITADNQGANIYEAFIIDILDYANTNKYKTIRSLWGFDANGTGTARLISGNWRNTNAITSISFTTDTGFKTPSQIALYGIKG